MPQRRGWLYARHGRTWHSRPEYILQMARAPIIAAATAILAASLTPAPALADNLYEAMEHAYRTNPTLLAARANLRATDEQVAIEKAASRPNLDSTATYNEAVRRSANSFTSPERTLSVGMTLSAPLYAGGSIKNAIRAAKTRVGAGQADLRSTESAVFSQVVASYMDVIQNEAIVGLNRNSVHVLEINLEATRDRFEIGDLTRTDVAQSEARLAMARSDLRLAEANLISARERYINVIGKPPEDLTQPPALAGMPVDVDRAVSDALADNPDIIAARERSKAAGYDVNVAGASRLPRFDLYSTGSYNNYFGTLGGPTSAAFAQRETSAQMGVSATIPLYQGGAPAARRRQAQERASALLEQQVATERDVIAQVRSAFSTWQATREVIASTERAVAAARLSLEGVSAENSVGRRTILDILNAEQELTGTLVRLVQAQRDEYVAGFVLQAAMGRAEASDLGLDETMLYDPNAHYVRVKNKWFDWDDNPAPAAIATRTVDTPAQTADISPAILEATESSIDVPGR